MKLAHKFTLAFLAGMIIIQGANSAFRIRREVALFETDMHRDHRLIGRALAAEISALWAAVGPAKAIAAVERANDERADLSIRWVWLDAATGSPDAPRVDAETLEPVARGGELAWLEPEEGQAGSLFTYVPVRVPDGRSGAIEIAESLEPERQYLATTVVLTVVVTLAIALVSTGLAWVLGTWFVQRPVRTLVAKARRVSVGDLSGRLNLRQRDEFGELADEINGMCDRLAEARERTRAETAARVAAIEQLRHADRLATVGTLASGVAHELGTPLNVVSERGKRVWTGEANGDDAKENGRIVVEQCARMTKIIRQVLDFAHPRAPSKSPEDLGALARRALALLGPLAEKRGVKCALEAPDPPVVACLAAGITSIAVLTQYQPRRLEAYVARRFAQSFLERGGALALVRTGVGAVPTYPANADAILDELDAVGGGFDTLLVLAADHVYRMDYGAFLAAHAASGADLTIGAVPVPIEDAPRFGVIEADPAGRVLGFVEKPASARPLPADPERALASMGIYVFRREALAAARLSIGRARGVDFGRDVVPALLGSGARVHVFRHVDPRSEAPGLWFDVGTPEALLAASLAVHPEGARAASAVVAPGAVVRRTVMRAGSVVLPGAVVEESFLLEGSVIETGARVRRAVVGPGARVREGVTLGPPAGEPGGVAVLTPAAEPLLAPPGP